MRKTRLTQFSKMALIGMHPRSPSLLYRCHLSRNHQAQELWGTASASCEFLSQQTPLCSAHSSCHQTPILLNSSDLLWKWSLWYLCQLTMLQLLLFRLQESLATSDHSPDHVYTPPFTATAGDTLPLPSYNPHNAVFSLHVLLISLSVQGRVIALAAREQRIWRLPARSPLGCLSLSGTVSGVTAHQAFILDLTRPRGDTH